MNSPFYEQVYVRGHMFEFSPLIINTYLNYPIMHSYRVKELDFNFNMHKVATKLIGCALSHWPTKNAIASAVLISKYSILHKIVITN